MPHHICFYTIREQRGRKGESEREREREGMRKEERVRGRKPAG